jgi:hypothetical protein
LAASSTAERVNAAYISRRLVLTSLTVTTILSDYILATDRESVIMYQFVIS